jgi:hypothetical protein
MDVLAPSETFQSTTLGTFAPFPIAPAQASINTAGELEYRVTTPEPRAFFRLENRQRRPCQKVQELASKPLLPDGSRNAICDRPGNALLIGGGGQKHAL